MAESWKFSLVWPPLPRSSCFWPEILLALERSQVKCGISPSPWQSGQAQQSCGSIQPAEVCIPLLSPTLPKVWLDGRVSLSCACGLYTMNSRWHRHQVLAFLVRTVMQASASCFFACDTASHIVVSFSIAYKYPDVWGDGGACDLYDGVPCTYDESACCYNSTKFCPGYDTNPSVVCEYYDRGAYPFGDQVSYRQMTNPLALDPYPNAMLWNW